jgi:DNA primase catalytic core
VTLSLHKLWAGSGYEYLTRQVARQDATHLGRSSLASYYTERGETPGVWVGAGLAGVDGLAVGEVVSAEQMRALFGAGHHPLAAERVAAARAGGASDRVAAETARLGSPFRLRSTSARGFDVEVNHRLTTRRAEPGGQSEVSSMDRSGVVSEVAAEWFVRDHGRPPADARELAGAVARWTRRVAQPVAGFDLTFSPVKSVSALWAVAPLGVAAEIERAHQAAVADALRFLEEQALFTREGTNGVRQVEVSGLVGTAFTHRDSRAGDPDLHTHVAVANKVQTRQGRWLAVDGRVLYAATVAASETYNTALEGHLGERLGVRFEARPAAGGRREVRELVGVDQRLLTGWSSRRQAIDVRRAELGQDFQDRTGRPPTRKEAWGLAQQATLETRTAKHEPRTLTEQRTTWSAQAARVLGGIRQVQAMVAATLAPAVGPPPEPVGAAWVARTAATVVSVMEGERATWGRFHLHAEAQRQVRQAGLEPGLAGQVVDLVVAESTNLSVLLRGKVGVAEPEGMRRSDGVSVYEPVGAQRWTSQRVLTAENLVLDLAARRDGRRVDPVSVQVALQEVAVEGVVLNAGQVGLVRDLAGSGARVQLALAPAGTGKTTALRVLSKAWTTAGGTVVGLAPSASAAAVLGEQLGGPTDTLAKLVWSLDHPGVGTPAWVTGLGAGSLVVVDEAGLADTPSVARAVQHIVAVGGSVRLVGDDRQLGAVGAGGLLRDLDQRFGAARLDEVVRFTDPAEAAASLALRDGRKEALGFYLDQHRVHVGDATTAPAQLLDGWAADRAAGRDALMLAPTRTAVADLNQAARSRRLHGQQSTREVALADGNHASTGDTIVTRTNDRRLRLPGHGWVRNGNRWTVDNVHRGGALTVTPVGGGAALRLPAEYVAASVELGYASTIHAAQGVTCDTVHGLVTGSESRPQLYTLLTRGRHANHLYLQTDGAADLHDLNRPDSGTAPTPTEVLERIIDRDGTAQSASSLLADLYKPALRLPVEIGRYLDAVHLAADRTADPAVIDQLNRVADRLLPDLRESPAWPVLRSHLLLCAADGADPARRLRAAAAVGPLDDARDPAAVLHHRASTLHQARTPDRPVQQGPLPWLPHLPHRLRADPTWGTYLQARSDLVSHLADQVHRTAVAARPEWATHLHPHVGNQVVGQVAVWRAARQVQVTDPILTGPPAAEHAARQWQQHLNQITGSGPTPSPPLPLVTRLTGAADHDPFRDTLSLHLASLAGQGVDVAQHLRTAAQRPLPDDHPSAALWWRLHRHLPTATLMTPHPATEPPELPDPDPTRLDAPAQPAGLFSPTSREARTDAAFLLAGLLRLARHHTRPKSAPEGGGEHRDRLLGVNRLAHDYYRAQLTGSWSARYLTERCGQHIADDVRFQPGHALHGWTSLVDHLRRHGVTEDDMINAGLASRTRQGRIVDRFRDRLILPLWNHDHDLVGFVARRHPDHDNTHGPKYLNTPTTTLFTKGHHLYGHHLLPPTTGLHGPNPNGSTDLVPVLVEGPLDAIAVTLAGHNHYVGLATLGTALTQTQAAALGALGVDPVLAPDNDPPGQTAATRNFWRLTPHGLDPQLAVLPPQQDPAGVLSDLGPDALRHLLTKATPQGDHLIRQQGVAAGEDQQSIDIQLRTTAARPPHTWAAAVNILSLTHHLPVQELREQLLPLAHEATRHPTDTAQRGEHLTHRPTAGTGPFTGRRAWPTQDSATATSPPQPDRTPLR